uniref:Uncharacterized protein n=1 Tax=Kalanchoe fedtschenkoi TaxID=63787 RepID=A0A7N0TMS0_KALFE
MATFVQFDIAFASTFCGPSLFSSNSTVISLNSITPTPTLPPKSNPGSSRARRANGRANFTSNVGVNGYAAEQAAEKLEAEVAEGLTITEFCDKVVDLFLNEKPKTKDWKKYLIFRDEWMKYRERFYSHCQAKAENESDANMKQKLISLGRKVKKIDDEMDKHAELLKEVQDSPTDINAIVTRRRKDFTEEFFRHLTLLSETFDSLEDRDAMARLGTRCLAAVSAYDNTLQFVDTLDTAQEKFDDILNSPSLEAACEKINSLARSKTLDSSLILLINSAWASAKESATLRSEVKEIMYQLYKTTKSSLRSIMPKEIKLLKYLLNITDPEERFSALATAFSPGDEHQAKDPNALHTTPKELHKWIKIMLDSYHLNKEETDIREAKQMASPMVIQRLFILQRTIEEEYLEKETKPGEEPKSSEEL